MPSHNEMAKWRREVRHYEEAHAQKPSDPLDRCASALMDCHSSAESGTAWAGAGEVTRDNFRRQAQAVLDAFNS